MRKWYSWWTEWKTVRDMQACERHASSCLLEGMTDKHAYSFQKNSDVVLRHGCLKEIYAVWHIFNHFKSKHSQNMFYIFLLLGYSVQYHIIHARMWYKLITRAVFKSFGSKLKFLLTKNLILECILSHAESLGSQMSTRSSLMVSFSWLSYQTSLSLKSEVYNSVYHAPKHIQGFSAAQVDSPCWLTHPPLLCFAPAHCSVAPLLQPVILG